MARSVADLGLLLRIISGSDGWDASVVPVPLGPLSGVSLKGLRIAYFADDDVMSPTEKTALTVEAAAKALADAGAEVEPARPAGWAEAVEISVGYWESHRGEMTTAEFYRLLEKWDAFRTEMLRFMLRHDAILSATCAFPAPLHDAMPDWRDGKSLSYLLPQSLAGCPAATVRCGWSPLGLPIGVQVSAAPWREDIALALAAHLEQAFGGWSPPLLDPSAESAASHKH